GSFLDTIFGLEDGPLALGVKHRVDDVLFTGLRRGNVLAVAILLVLVDELVEDAKADRLTQGSSEHRDSGRNFLTLLRVVHLHDLIFRFLLGERLAGRGETDVIDRGEARERDLLRLVVLVEEEVLAVLVGDVDRLTILPATDI